MSWVDYVDDFCYGRSLPSQVYALPSLYLGKYAPIHRRGEMRYIENNDGSVMVGFGRREKTLIPVKKSGGDIALSNLSALMECGYSLAAAGLISRLFLMWHSGDGHNFLPDKEGGYGCFEFVPDDCKTYFGGEKWSRVRRLFCEVSDVLKLEKLKKGKWRVIFLLERRNRMLYNDSEKEARRFGSVYKYLELHELDIKRKAMQYFESKRKAEQESKDSGGGEKVEQGSKDSGGGDVFDGIDFGC